MLSHTLPTHGAHVFHVYSFASCVCVYFCMCIIFPWYLFPPVNCCVFSLYGFMNLCCMRMLLKNWRWVPPFRGFCDPVLTFVLLEVCCRLPMTLFDAFSVYVCYVAMVCFMHMCSSKMGEGFPLSRFLWSCVDLRSSRSVLPGSHATFWRFSYKCMLYDVYGVLCVYVFSKIGDGLSLFRVWWFDVCLRLFGIVCACLYDVYRCFECENSNVDAIYTEFSFSCTNFEQLVLLRPIFHPFIAFLRTLIYTRYAHA